MLFICQALVDRFPALWGSLRSELARLETECEIIPGENPWIRDYMPVRIPDLGLFQFRYAPEYHRKSRYRESEVVHVPKRLSKKCFKLDWVMDGGGVLADDSVVLLSAKFPPPAPTMLKIFEGKTVLTVPTSTKDFTGHLDGLCRLHGRKFLFHDYAWEDIPSWNSMCERMSELSYEPVEIPSAVMEGQDDSAQGVYLNYMLVGNCAFVPVSTEVDLNRQQLALKALQQALGLEIIEIPADECARQGGALHCVMWSDSHLTFNCNSSS